MKGVRVALPSRQEQIEHIEKFLDYAADQDPAWSLREIATKLVGGYHDMLTSGIKTRMPGHHVGLAFKTPFFTKVSYIAWVGDDSAWVVDVTSTYGCFIRLDSPLWNNFEESQDNRKPKVDKETGEVPPLAPRPGSPGQNPAWNVGDKVSNMQRISEYVVVATGDKCVLLQSTKDSWRFMPESNANMAQYYKKEIDVWT